MTDATPSSGLVGLADEELARRARAGSVVCFEEIVRRYQVPLLRFLRRRPGAADAEDVLQEAFLRAYQSLDRYSDAWPLRTWMFTLTYRLAVNHARRARPMTADVEHGAEIADAGEDPHERLEREESGQELWALARRALSDEQYNALWLHYGQDLPPREVARVMGRSWVWVKTNLHRARRKLLTELEGERAGRTGTLKDGRAAAAHEVTHEHQA